MGANNECSAEMDGRRAAVDLALANRPDDFTQKCWSIDQKLNSNDSAYNRAFVSAMNNELETRNLLPKIELNMVNAGETQSMRALQQNKHVETQDLVRDEDQLGRSGRSTEAMLMHRLSSNAQIIHDTHAERNFWGKNHGGIDMNRLNRWAEQNPANMFAATQDVRSTRNDAPAEKVVPNGPQAFDANPMFPDLPRQRAEQPKPSEYDRKQDAEISRLHKDVEEQRKAQEQIQKANELKAKVEAGVIKDAHHTVKHGETLYDMACLALHKAGRDHMTPQAIRFEEEKIRALNHLGPHEALRSGQSLMLRTEQEVEHETARRIKSYQRAAKPSESSETAPTTNDNNQEFPWGRRPRNNNSGEQQPRRRVLIAQNTDNVDASDA